MYMLYTLRSFVMVKTIVSSLFKVQRDLKKTANVIFSQLRPVNQKISGNAEFEDSVYLPCPTQVYNIKYSTFQNVTCVHDFLLAFSCTHTLQQIAMDEKTACWRPDV